MPVDNLSQLKDIHLPTDVSGLPLGYGWAVILLAAICAVILVELTLYLRKKSKKIYALYLLKKIKNGDEFIIESAAKISEILRRICTVNYKEATTLIGDKWIKFLNEKTKLKIGGKAALLLAQAPYLPRDTKGFTTKELTDLQEFCHHWIGENL